MDTNISLSDLLLFASLLTDVITLCYVIFGDRNNKKQREKAITAKASNGRRLLYCYKSGERTVPHTSHSFCVGHSFMFTVYHIFFDLSTAEQFIVDSVQLTVKIFVHNYIFT